MMPRLVALLRKSGEWIAPIAAVVMVFVMLVPLPSFILDLLLTFPVCCCCSPCSVCRSTWPAPGAFCCMAMRVPRLRVR
jgi:hypothetical protein